MFPAAKRAGAVLDLAQAGLLTAMIWILQIAAAYLPSASLLCRALSAVILLLLTLRLRWRWGILAYCAVALLSSFVAPGWIQALPWLFFFGPYPLLMPAASWTWKRPRLRQSEECLEAEVRRGRWLMPRWLLIGIGALGASLCLAFWMQVIQMHPFWRKASEYLTWPGLMSLVFLAAYLSVLIVDVLIRRFLLRYPMLWRRDCV